MDSDSAKLPEGYVPAIVREQSDARVVVRRDDGSEEFAGTMPVDTVLQGRDAAGKSLIVPPNAEAFSLCARLASGRYCGNCRSYNHRRGQELAAQQQFFSRIKLENGWTGGSRWTGPPTNYGLCEHFGDAMVYCLAPADADPSKPGSGCEEYRPDRGKIVFSGFKSALGIGR